MPVVPWKSNGSLCQPARNLGVVWDTENNTIIKIECADFFTETCISVVGEQIGGLGDKECPIQSKHEPER